MQCEVFTDSAFSVESISFDPVFDQPGEILLFGCRVVLGEFKDQRAAGSVISKMAI